MTTNDPDQDRGLYPKYKVHKIKRETDQRGEETEVLVDPGECFVLNHADPHAPAALAAYAEACAQTYPKLSQDLYEMATRWLEGR